MKLSSILTIMSRALGDDSTIIIDETMHKITSSRRTSCDICRERKIRCDKGHPACERCKRLKLNCTYKHQSDTLDVSRALMQLHERLRKLNQIHHRFTRTQIYRDTRREHGKALSL